MLSCNEICRLVAGDELAEAGWRRRLEGRLHLLMCRYCRRYEAQLRAIGVTARRLFLRSEEGNQATLERLGKRLLASYEGPAARSGGDRDGAR